MEDQALEIIMSLTDTQIEIFLCRKRLGFDNKQILKYLGVSRYEIERTFRRIRFLSEHANKIISLQELIIHSF